MTSAIDKMCQQTAGWLSGEGADSDIVISSRTRLARNLQNISFVDRATEDEHKESLSKVLNAVKDNEFLNDGFYFDISILDDLDRQFFVERRLISTDFIEKDNPRGFFVTPNEETSIMINEEDHFRIQKLCSGFNLEETWHYVHQVYGELSRDLTFAFSERFGYLTACPTNVGTGVRFSVFIHLPVLTFTKEIEKVFAEMIPTGIAVRGFNGEGSKVIGNFFQISNQFTLGWTEQGILDRVIPFIKRFVSLERDARDRVMNDDRIMIEDKIYRALGILANVRILSSIEFLDLLSALRLGADLDMVNNINRKSFNELIVFTQPAHIQKIEGRKLTERERDTIRARLVREKLHFN